MKSVIFPSVPIILLVLLSSCTQQQQQHVSSGTAEQKLEKAFNELVSEAKSKSGPSLNWLNVEARMRQLELRIANGERNKSLTAEQVGNLRSSLNTLKEQHGMNIKTGSGVSQDEVDRMVAQISRLNSRMDSWLAGRDRKWF